MDKLKFNDDEEKELWLQVVATSLAKSVTDISIIALADQVLASFQEKKYDK